MMFSIIFVYVYKNKHIYKYKISSVCVYMTIISILPDTSVLHPVQTPFLPFPFVYRSETILCSEYFHCNSILSMFPLAFRWHTILVPQSVRLRTILSLLLSFGVDARDSEFHLSVRVPSGPRSGALRPFHHNLEPTTILSPPKSFSVKPMSCSFLNCLIMER